MKAIRFFLIASTATASLSPRETNLRAVHHRRTKDTPVLDAVDDVVDGVGDLFEGFGDLVGKLLPNKGRAPTSAVLGASQSPSVIPTSSTASTRPPIALESDGPSTVPTNIPIASKTSTPVSIKDTTFGPVALKSDRPTKSPVASKTSTPVSIKDPALDPVVLKSGGPTKAPTDIPIASETSTPVSIKNRPLDPVALESDGPTKAPTPTNDAVASDFPSRTPSRVPTSFETLIPMPTQAPVGLGSDGPSIVPTGGGIIPSDSPSRIPVASGTMAPAFKVVPTRDPVASSPAKLPTPAETMKPTVAGPSSVMTLTLVNAEADTEVGLLRNDTVINVAQTRQLNIRANVPSPSSVDSVKFLINGTFTYFENAPPYAAFANNGTDYFPWTPSLGRYEVTAAAYSEDDGQGDLLMAVAVSFMVVDQ